MDTSVNAANQVVSVGADIAFDADPKFFACLVRFESSSVPTKTQSRSEERFSRNAETDLVCRLLLEKKKIKNHLISYTATLFFRTCLILVHSPIMLYLLH